MDDDDDDDNDGDDGDGCRLMTVVAMKKVRVDEAEPGLLIMMTQIPTIYGVG